MSNKPVQFRKRMSLKLKKALDLTLRSTLMAPV